MRKSLSPVETSVKVCNCMVPKTETFWQDTAHKAHLPLCPQATLSKDNFSQHKDYSSVLHLPSNISRVQATQMSPCDSSRTQNFHSFQCHTFILMFFFFICSLPLVYSVNSLVSLIMLSVTMKNKMTNSTNKLNTNTLFPLKSVQKTSLQIKKKEKTQDQNSGHLPDSDPQHEFLQLTDSWHSMQNVRRDAWRSMTWPGVCWWVWGASYQPWLKAHYGREACLHPKLIKQS